MVYLLIFLNDNLFLPPPFLLLNMWLENTNYEYLADVTFLIE
jgi:hypothetical protein